MATQIDAFGDGGTTFGALRLWVGKGITVNGVVTVHPTDNGLESGNAFFGEIRSYAATPLLGTGVAKDVPGTALKSISSDKKTVEINVVRGVTIVLGLLPCASLQFVPDGTEVGIQIWGIAPG